ncbi:MAG: aldo/keto reductase [Tannerella sp.]|jgi:aryl-alcohol dehydrogenase-like predicted oxidoreductase|nr:aldo/keto reductase [Tannerella sp.]
MEQMNRREFIRTGVSGLAGLSLAGVGVLNAGCTLPAGETFVDRVKLGDSGLTVSRIAMGTGSVGGNKSSNQTRLGMDNFVKLAHHAYERGIRFYDMADSYGSMPFVGEAIQRLPRNSLTLLSKIWTTENGSEGIVPVEQELDRFRKEARTDYFDILLMHCMTDGNWAQTRTYYMDALAKARQDGIVKAVGISSHHIDALNEAATNPWVDVIMARINPFGSKMDGSPDEVNAVLEKAKRNGKGIIAMKVFGEGTHVSDAEREQSIGYVVRETNVHCMTLGLESESQMDDAVERVMKAVRN